MVGAFSVVCLLALPVAPQFVGFDRGMTAKNSAFAVSNASLDSSFPRASVIPAALRTSGSSSGAVTPRMTSVKVVHAHAPAGHQVAPVEVVAAGMSDRELPRDLVVPISARLDQEIVPQFQATEFRTVVFFETTQYVTSDSTVWRVQVWHVMLVGSERERSARVPVVNSL
jgi:hypothetical protein